MFLYSNNNDLNIHGQLNNKKTNVPISTINIKLLNYVTIKSIELIYQLLHS